MKKLFLVVLALLLCVGVANATNIPRAVDAVNGREIWVTSVFVNETTNPTFMDVGDCAQWDMDSSTGDDKNYVVQCDATDTYLVAGIIWPAQISGQTVGLMAIKGPVQADTTSDVLGAGFLMCASEIDGYVQPCSASGTTDPNAIGFVTTAGGTSTATVNIILR